MKQYEIKTEEERTQFGFQKLVLGTTANGTDCSRNMQKNCHKDMFLIYSFGNLFQTCTHSPTVKFVTKVKSLLLRPVILINYNKSNEEKMLKHYILTFYRGCYFVSPHIGRNQNHACQHHFSQRPSSGIYDFDIDISF